MGREVKRVPLDFDWPIGKVWHGYLLPDELDEDRCDACRGTGYTNDGHWLSRVAYVIAGLADDATAQERGREMHPWLKPLEEISYGYGAGRPTRAFAEFANGLREDIKAPDMFGTDVHRVTSALREAAGLPEKWGWCPTCEGHGSIERYEGQRAEAEAWESTDPPTGEGWQLWSTTSEGEPMTPVFPTREALARHCVDNGVSWFGYNTATYEQWLTVCDGALAMTTIAPGVVIL